MLSPKLVIEGLRLDPFQAELFFGRRFIGRDVEADEVQVRARIRRPDGVLGDGRRGRGLGILKIHKIHKIPMHCMMMPRCPGHFLLKSLNWASQH